MTKAQDELLAEELERISTAMPDGPDAGHVWDAAQALRRTPPAAGEADEGVLDEDRHGWRTLDSLPDTVRSSLVAPDGPGVDFVDLWCARLGRVPNCYLEDYEGMRKVAPAWVSQAADGSECVVDPRDVQFWRPLPRSPFARAALQAMPEIRRSLNSASPTPRGEGE